MRDNLRYLPILFLLLCVCVSPAAFSQSSTKELKTLISKNISTIGLSKEDAADYSINSNYRDDGSGIEYVYIQQTYKGIKVFNVIISLAFKNGNLLYSSGKFLNKETSFRGIDIPAIEAGSAVSRAARHLKLAGVSTPLIRKNNFKVDKKISFIAERISKRDIETELLWVQDDSGRVHLAWNVSIDLENSHDWWNVRVDALTGEIVNKDNWTVHEKFTPTDVNVQPKSEKPGVADRKFAAVETTSNQSRVLTPPSVLNAAYLVVPFPRENRNDGGLAVDNNPWLRAGSTNNATTHGWHFDGSVNYSTTRGNNAYAYDDSSNINNPGRTVTSSSQPPFVNFDVSPNFSIQPFDSTNRNFGVVNLFYWNNILHDLSYQYGFTESAGNFQADNIGRGGTGNDYVKAEAQDGAGTDNAFFSSPPDGFNGRMQMYLFTAAPEVRVTVPDPLAGNYIATESQLSSENKLIKKGPLSGQVVIYDDQAAPGTTHEACDSTRFPGSSVAGKIALISRGSCPFTTKMRTAQHAGAIGVIIVNNVDGPPTGMGGTDNLITIPGIMISKEDGLLIASQPAGSVIITMSTGIFLDGDIDNGVIAHEYGHGISNRLTGGRTNSSCLSNAEQAGEGWSDYLSLMLTTNWQNAQLTDGSKPRPMATYASGQPGSGRGIRRVPYTTDMLIDTLTYASMDGNAAGNGEEHNIGEIWCSALWDMTWNIIRHEGSINPDLYNSTGSGGNIIALRLVIEGMKLQPCRPGFLDGRNAILAADSILFNNRHKCDIWNAFARRGMGFSAIQGLSSSTADQVPAFDVPSTISLNKSTVTSTVNANSQITYNTTITCQCLVPAETYTITDTIPSGFTYVSSNNGTLVNNMVRFAAAGFTDPLQSITLTLTLKATGAGCAIIKPVNDDREVNLSGGLTSGRIIGNTNWIVSQNHSFSGTSAWYAADPFSSSNLTLASGSFVPGSLSVLSFWHYFVTEPYVDGGKVEISADDGTSWTDAAPYFLQNGYNARLNNVAPQPNTPAFTGNSYTAGSSNNGQFIQSLVDLSSFASQSIRIRFRFQTNNSNTDGQFYEGWYIDDILVSTGCGGIGKIAVVNSSGTRIDSVSRPFFIVSNNALPLEFVSFSAKQNGGAVLLNWETISEINTRNFEIERSTDGVSWSKIGTVTAKESGKNLYGFNDENPLEKLSYYRLRVNDRDGKFSYTVIKKIEFNVLNIVSVNPNPATSKATVYFGINARGGVLSVTDLQGRVVHQHIIPENAFSYAIPTAGLPSGTYLIRVQSKAGLATKKLVVAH